MQLLERDADLGTLLAQWYRAQGGTGGLVLVTGESGAGKSSLVQAFAAELPAGERVLWGACDPLSTPRPLGPLFDVADQLEERSRTTLREAEHPHDIFSAVLDELRSRPTLLVVEDLHWADQGTIDLLRFLLRRIGATPSMLVGTVRADEVEPSDALRELLGDVARSPDAQSLPLEPLSSAAVRTLVEGRPIDPERLHALTGGNPFFVTEMLRHDGRDLPGSVRDAVLARTVDLDNTARSLLDLLVCAPEAIPDRLLPRLGVGVPPLRALDRAGLIRRSQRGVAFRHDLCRLAVASALPPGSEVTLHLRMLDALESVPGADPAVLAHHARGAHDGERTLRYAAAAGLAAARAGAHSQAAAFFRSALDEGHLAPPVERAGLLERLGAELYLLDRLADAIRAVRAAMTIREQLGDATGVSADHQALSVYEWYDARRPVAEQHAGQAVAVLSGTDERMQLGHALAWQGYLATHRSDLVLARGLADVASGIAAEVGDPTLDVRTGLLQSICGMHEGQEGARDALLEIVTPSAERFDDLYSSGYSNIVYLDVEQRRLPEAAELLDLSIRLTVEWDVPICNAWQVGTRGRLRLLTGDWSAAETDAEAVLGSATAPLARCWPLVVRGLVRLRRDGTGHDHREGLDPPDDLDAAWELASRYDEPLRLLPAAAALAERAWLSGRPDERLAGAAELLRSLPGVGLEWSRGELAVWLRRVDPGWLADVEHLAEPHRLLLAGEHLAAAKTWLALSSPYDEGLALVESRDPDSVRRGLDILDQLGADAVAARLRQDLRDSGMAGVPTRRRASTRRNPAGLTTRELEVLALLDEGLTNAEVAARLFISAKTADHHVSSILSKLRVGSRRDAARTGRELGLVG